MGAGRKTQTISVQENVPWSTVPDNGCFSARKLRVGDLCGVILGCTHDTMAECLSKQIFGLPYGHISYVKNIGVGLPLFLFNYSDRKLHGIFEAASHGATYLDPSAWTDGGSQRTPYPAQVRIRSRIQCEALVENQFRKVLENNYYTPQHFWFELDRTQTNSLISLFKPSKPPRNTILPPVASREKELFPALPATKSVASSKKECAQVLLLPTFKDVVSHNLQNIKDHKQPNNVVNENKFASLICNDGDPEQDSSTGTSSNILEDMESKEPVSDWEDLAVDNVETNSSGVGTSFDGENHASEKQHYTGEASECEEKRILHMLENLAANNAHLNSYSNGSTRDSIICRASGDVYENGGNVLAKKEDYLTASCLNHGSAQGVENSYASNFNGNAEVGEYSNAFDLNHGNVELVQFIKELKVWAADVKNHQVESDWEVQHLRNQLWYSDRRIGLLEDRVKELELKIDPSKLVDESLDKFVKQYLGSADVIYLIGGFDGCSWLSALDSFSPSLDILTPLKSMGSARSNASAVALDGNLFVFGGKSGRSWYDTVEYYNRRHDEWISCPSMLRKKGSLSGATLNGKIFAIGGGDGIECLSDVETFDPAIGKWYTNKPMLYKRFASAAAELKGAIYALGGYDGNQYLRSAEKFDPREGYWTELPRMNTKRGSHALAVFNENLYCVSGFNGQKMVSSVEIFEPRLNVWMMGEPMKFARGYAAAAALGNSLFAIGGIDDEKEIVDTVECYKEGVGWASSGLKAIGKRCFCSAIVL